jgi:hypothetical protein
MRLHLAEINRDAREAARPVAQAMTLIWRQQHARRKIDTPIMPPHWRRNMLVEVATPICRDTGAALCDTMLNRLCDGTEADTDDEETPDDVLSLLAHAAPS